MAKGDLFHNPTSKMPMNDPRVVRIPLDKEDMGARKSFTSKTIKKNDMSIQHVKS